MSHTKVCKVNFSAKIDLLMAEPQLEQKLWSTPIISLPQILQNIQKHTLIQHEFIRALKSQCLTGQRDSRAFEVSTSC